MSALHHLPTPQEMPLDGPYVTDPYEILGIAVIPTDDRQLRDLAIKFFAENEELSRAFGCAIKRKLESLAEIDQQILDTRALTPGGIAWKLLQVLDWARCREGDNWRFDRYLLQAACADALELERRRSA